MRLLLCLLPVSPNRRCFARFGAVLLGAILIAASSAPLSLAQDPRGLISGRVLDPSGAAVPDAEIKVTQTATNVTTRSISNEQGIYEVRYLLPGVYSVRVTAQGFKTYDRSGIEVRVADRIALDVNLVVGDVTELVTVKAEAPLLEASTASLGTVVGQRRIEDLPFHGGNTFRLAQLAAGVISFVAPNLPTELTAIEVVARIGVNGTPQGSTEFTIDGAPSMFGTAPSYAPPPDLVSEFKVQTATYDAGIGRAPGGVINVAMRSGTNQIHGTLYEFHNDDHLQSMDLFQRQFLYNPATGPVTDAKRKQAVPQNVFNRYGATMGGPMVLPKLYNGRNRTFWVYGFEGYRRVRTEPGSFYFTVPTLAERIGDFSSLLALGPQYQIYDPATIAPASGGRFSRQPFPNNVIPRSRLDGAAQNILNYWPAPNTTGTADGRNNYFRPRRTWDEFASHSFRMDHNLRDNHRIFGRVYYTDQTWRGAGQVFDNNATGRRRLRTSEGFGFDDVYTFSPSLMMNFRYSLARFAHRFEPLAFGFNLASLGLSPSLINLIDPQAVTFPEIAVDGYQTLGSYASSSYTNYHVWAVDFTKTHSAHSIRLGYEFRLYRECTYNFTRGTPRIEFSTAWTRGPLDSSAASPIGQGLASFVLGIPTGGSLDINASAAEQSASTAFYLQDEWKVSRRLTLNLGLRYDYDGPATERFNRSVRGFDFASSSPIEAYAKAQYGLNPIPEIPVDRFRVIGGLTFAGVDGQPRRLWNGDKNNFSPRIGFAYTLNDKTVARGGYGIYYVPLGVDRMSVNQTGFSMRTAIVPSTDNGLTFVASLSNPFPQGIQQPAGASGGLMTNVGQGVSFFNTNPKNGYMQRWSFGLQRELPAGVVSEVSYVGNRGTKLGVDYPLNPMPIQYLSRSPVRDQGTIDYLSAKVPNPFYPLLPGTDLAAATVNRSQLLRPFPHFTGISVAQPVGYSWYHSLQATAERRLAQGFSLQANYVWSKYMEATSFLNSGDSKLEEAISPDDRQHHFTASGIWNLPLGRGRALFTGLHGLMQHLIGNWSVQAIWQTSTGAPLTFGNVLFVGDITKIALPKSERRIDRWFNTSGFERNAAKQLGSNFRTFPSCLSGVRAPGINLWDVSLIKRFAVTERVRVQLRGEFLNAANRSHLAAPATAPTNTLFGQITSTTGFPRQVHFALKVQF